MSSRTEESYEARAEQARLLLDLPTQLRLTGVQLLEAAKAKGVISGYTVLDDGLMVGKGGHYDGS
jgi:hypothetical protein